MERVRMLDGIGGKVAYDAVTTDYADLFSSAIEGRVVNISVANSLNAEVKLSFDGGTTTYIHLPAGASLSLDLGANGLEWSGTLSVAADDSLPTSGILSVGIIRAR
jgi:hypothetical protein